MAGRSLSVTAELFDTVLQLQDLHPVNQMQSDTWSDVGTSLMSFDLHAASTILLTYSLPISQSHNLDFDSLSTSDWGSVATRLVVDGKAYRHGTSSIDDTSTESATGKIVLTLQAGSSS